MEELMQNISELRKEIKQYIGKTDRRLDLLERNANAGTYIAVNAKEKAALDILDTAIIVLTGGMVVMMGMALLALMR